MQTEREVWFRPGLLRGFSAVHWKGPAFIAMMMAIGIGGAMIALRFEVRQPILTVIGIGIAVGALVWGSYVCMRHTDGS